MPCCRLPLSPAPAPSPSLMPTRTESHVLLSMQGCTASLCYLAVARGDCQVTRIGNERVDYADDPTLIRIWHTVAGYLYMTYHCHPNTRLRYEPSLSRFPKKEHPGNGRGPGIWEQGKGSPGIVSRTIHVSTL